MRRHVGGLAEEETEGLKRLRFIAMGRGHLPPHAVSHQPLGPCRGTSEAEGSFEQGCHLRTTAQCRTPCLRLADLRAFLCNIEIGAANGNKAADMDYLHFVP